MNIYIYIYIIKLPIGTEVPIYTSVNNETDAQVLGCGTHIVGSSYLEYNSSYTNN